MLELLSYGFMQRAFLAGVLVALSVACIGMVTVLRRQSMIGDALSHSSLAGVSIGLIAGVNPVGIAIVVSVLSAFGIEIFRRFFPKLSEIATAVIMSTGIGLAGVLSGFVTAASFNSYLFGSLLSIPDEELLLVVVFSLVVLVLSALLYKELFFLGFDQEAARLAGVPARAINFIFTLLTAITIAIAARTVGTLVVSAQIVLPVASAMHLAKSYRGTYTMSMILSLFYTLLGLTLSSIFDLKPGGTIVITSVLGLILVITGRSIYEKIRSRMRGGRNHIRR